MRPVQHGPDGLFVYTVKPDDTVQEQAVQLAYQDDDIAVIGKGLTGGENVVLTGQSRLAPGTRVAMNAGKFGARASKQLGADRPMSISTPFIRRPIATSLLTAAVFLAGLVAFPLLPVAPLPNVEFPTLAVTANYPGASPETMASTVATPLETEFGQMLPGLAQMTSTSVLGSTQITLQFDLSTDIKCRSHHGAGGDQRGRGLAAEEHAESADVPRDQSVGCADPDPVDAVGPGADHRGG